MHVFSKESPPLVLMSLAAFFVAFVPGIVLIVWGEISGGVCSGSQLRQNLCPTSRRPRLLTPACKRPLSPFTPGAIRTDNHKAAPTRFSAPRINNRRPVYQV